MAEDDGNALRDKFLEGMSCVASTVNVVTTDGAEGRAGVTVSAMTSVSADGDAPAMLVCVHYLSPAAATILANGCFCANILRDDQSYISDTFAGRIKPPDGDKFSCARWAAMKTGAPRVRDPLAAFDCRVRSSERVGTHHVFFGDVQDIFVAGDGSPLIYANRAYGSPVRISPARAGAPDKDRAAVGTLKIGTLHTFGPYLLPAILRQMEDEVGRVNLELHEGDQRHLTELLRSGTIDLAFLYDFDLGPDITTQVVAELSPYVLLSEMNDLARKAEVTFDDLLERPMVLLDAPPSGEYFLSLFKDIGTPNVAYRAKSFEMVRGMVAHGLGYSLLATKPASAMSYDGKALVMRPLADRPVASQLVLCQRRDAPSTNETDIFVRYCVEVIAGHGE